MAEYKVVLCLRSAILFLLASGALSATFTVTNSCGYTVWPGVLSSAGTAALGTTGFVLSPGESRNLDVPASWSGRLWGRTLCSTTPPLAPSPAPPATAAPPRRSAPEAAPLRLPPSRSSPSMAAAGWTSTTSASSTGTTCRCWWCRMAGRAETARPRDAWSTSTARARRPQSGRRRVCGRQRWRGVQERFQKSSGKNPEAAGLPAAAGLPMVSSDGMVFLSGEQISKASPPVMLRISILPLALAVVLLVSLLQLLLLSF
uniref:Thaumatin-like protein 1 n=1 Tax=Ananas comosus var. bracteatus TaxID=296719 RepID=A0A6V7PXL8_ANACO|nr:unnamed protein product [Ananas comosus var. bracteatus]